MQKRSKTKAKSKPRPKTKVKSHATPKVPTASFGLTPLGDRVLVLESKASMEKKTDSGIYIPSSVKEDRGAKRGTVVAIGRGKHEDGKLIVPSVKVGDEVLYGWGESVTYEGTEYTLVRDGDISAIVR